MLVASVSWLTALADIAMVAECDVNEVVVRQPITLWVSFQNMGAESVGIIPVWKLGQNMHFMYYEVTEPDGTTSRRKHCYLTRFGIIDPDFPGEPLGPGELVEVTLNPTMSETLAGEPRRVGFTFPSPGIYVLTVCYWPAYYRTMWRPDNDEPLRSNGVTFVVRAATPEEDEILDAFWSGSALDNVSGDAEIPVEVDVQRIREVLRRYDANPLADYLRFNLARGLISRDIGDMEAAALLETLRTRDFRVGEVEQVLATAYAGRGDRAKALDVLFDGIVRRPRFLDNDDYVRRLVWARYGGHDRVMEWEQECVQGKRREHAGIELPRRVMYVRRAQ
jgi:hypothetical protein